MMAFKLLFGDRSSTYSQIGESIELSGVRLVVDGFNSSIDLRLGRRWLGVLQLIHWRSIGNRHQVILDVFLRLADREVWSSYCRLASYRTDWWTRWKQRHGLAPKPEAFDEFDCLDELLEQQDSRWSVVRS